MRYVGEAVGRIGQDRVGVEFGFAAGCRRSVRGAVLADGVDGGDTGEQAGGEDETPGAVGVHVSGRFFELDLANPGDIGGVRIDAKAVYAAEPLISDLLIQVALGGIGAQLPRLVLGIPLAHQTELAGARIHLEGEKPPLVVDRNVNDVAHAELSLAG